MNAPLESQSSTIDPRVTIRPEVSTAKTATSEAEQFQNQVLRPIIKMQNDLLVNIYRHFLLKRKVKFSGMSVEARTKWIEQSVSKDNRLRGLLLGMVIGHFTQEEFQQFLDMEGEVRRRITNLITQRLQSQMKTLL
ncbi:MAG: hypothetical protein AAF242_04205 [Bacteroidota bacterium]